MALVHRLGLVKEIHRFIIVKRMNCRSRAALTLWGMRSRGLEADISRSRGNRGDEDRRVEGEKIVAILLQKQRIEID